MITIRVTRSEDNGTETELGEIRLVETGVVASYRAAADGVAVVGDMVTRLRTEPVSVRLDNPRELNARAVRVMRRDGRLH